MTGNYKEHFNHKESKVFYKTLALFAVLCLLIMSFITISHNIIK
jgi:hypothetical protein